MKRKIKHTVLAALLTAATLWSTQAPALADTNSPSTVVDVTQAVDTILTNDIAGWPQGPVITSTAAIVMEPSTGTILYSKNPDLALYPSSAVKVMTALVALENSSLTDNVTMTATGVAGATDGGAHISAQIDEVFTMEQCLYAIMLGSANDISLQVAEHVGGSVDNFVAMMNQKAADLGCTNTLFTNPTGMPDENQHTCARDLAIIMKAAMANEDFRTIASTLTYTIPATNLSSGTRVLTSTFKMLDPKSDAYYTGCLGGKEGYTSASGSVLTCMANRNGIDLICAVMNGAADQTDDEAITILDYAYNNFEMMNLSDDDFNILSGGDVMVPNGTTKSAVNATDSPDDEGTLDRVYTYNGATVGTGKAEIVKEEENTLAIESQKNIEEAKTYSEEPSKAPYAAIFGAGGALFLLFGLLLVKVLKKK